MLDTAQPVRRTPDRDTTRPVSASVAAHASVRTC